MHDFYGFGTTRMFVEELPVKLRIHSFLFEKVEGHVHLMYKEFMRDTEWLPSPDQGWQVFKNADLNFETLETAPTKPIAGYDQVIVYLKVSNHVLAMQTNDSPGGRPAFELAKC
jgi:hypothetical protein